MKRSDTVNYLIISDIHGSHERLKDVLGTPLSYDGIICVGDHLYHGPRNPILDDYNPAAVADTLNTLNTPILAVRGNCDSEVDQMVLYYPMMQDYTILNNDEKTIFITHGHIHEPKDAHLTRSDVFISGHTHIPGFSQVKNTLCVNPGSISLPKEGHPPTYAYLDASGITIYDLDHEVYMRHKFNEPL